MRLEEKIIDEIQMENLKKCELEILKNFIEVCEKLKLKYYLMGGTLLGAVRHQGFIPWDDDIDVGMLRSDYEIFIEKGQELLQEKYFLQTHVTDKEYPYNFAKIRDTQTTFKETCVRNFDMNHGVFIDIFPLDVYPDKNINKKLLEFKKNFITSRIKEAFYYEKPLLRTSLGKIQLFIAEICYSDYRTAVKKKEKLLKSCKKGNMIANHGGAWGAKEIVPAEWYAEGTMLEFEGIPVRGPKEYKLWLTQVYGDYMKLPPVEKRVTHHYTDVIDVEKSYKYYQNMEP